MQKNLIFFRDNIFFISESETIPQKAYGKKALKNDYDRR